MYITYTQESIDVVYALEESLDMNSTYICAHMNDERSQDVISQLKSNSYSMYKAAKFILESIRKSTSDVLGAVDSLDVAVKIGAICSGVEIPPSDDKGGQGSEET